MSATEFAISRDDLQKILQEIQRETKVPAIGVSISINGTRMCEAVGQAALNRSHALNERSRFEVSCLMKLVTSLVALELAARDQFDLSAPIAHTLPELGMSGGEPIAAKHLMSHTSGYRGVDISDGAVRWGFSWEKLIGHLQQHERSFRPGAVFNYDHTEHILLAEMIHRQSGRTVAQWARELIFDACGADLRRPTSDGDAFVAQHVFSEKRGGFVPATLPPFCSFWEPSLPDSTITLADVVAIGELVLAVHRRTKAGDGLSPVALRHLQRCEIRLSNQVACNVHHERIPSGFGTAFAQYGAGLLGHNASSSGQTTGLRLDLERDAVIAVGVNAYVPYVRDSVIERVLAKLSGGTPSRVERTGDGFSFEQLAGHFVWSQLVGRYAGSYFGEIQVSGDSEQLHLDLGSQRRAGRPRVSIVPLQDGRFTLQSQVPTLIGFFADPRDGMPVLAMGVHAYKKQHE